MGNESCFIRPMPVNPLDIPMADVVQVNCASPLLERNWKRVKASVSGEITSEAFAADTETSIDVLYDLYVVIIKEDMVTGWNDGNILKINTKYNRPARIK